MAARKWRDLSTGTRRFLVAAAVAEGSLKLAALIDLKRRPADQVRGSKWLWAALISVVNGFGVAPLSYFTLGRKR